MVAVYVVLAIGTALVAYFIFWVFGRAYLKFKGTRVITCPETQHAAAVKLNAHHAALSSVINAPDLVLSACTRWPERQDCGQECLRQIEAAPDDCLVKNILIRWYQGKTCVYCRRPLSGINWIENRPALLNTEGRTFEWHEIPPEKIPEVLKTHLPVCFDCHIAETFRREHPDLVVDRDFAKTRH